MHFSKQLITRKRFLVTRRLFCLFHQICYSSSYIHDSFSVQIFLYVNGLTSNATTSGMANVMGRSDKSVTDEQGALIKSLQLSAHLNSSASFT